MLLIPPVLPSDATLPVFNVQLQFPVSNEMDSFFLNPENAHPYPTTPLSPAQPHDRSGATFSLLGPTAAEAYSWMPGDWSHNGHGAEVRTSQAWDSKIVEPKDAGNRVRKSHEKEDHTKAEMKEAKRKSLREKRDSVQEWLKSVEIGRKPSSAWVDASQSVQPQDRKGSATLLPTSDATRPEITDAVRKISENRSEQKEQERRTDKEQKDRGGRQGRDAAGGEQGAKVVLLACDVLSVLLTPSSQIPASTSNIPEGLKALNVVTEDLDWQSNGAHHATDYGTTPRGGPQMRLPDRERRDPHPLFREYSAPGGFGIPEEVDTDGGEALRSYIQDTHAEQTMLDPDGSLTLPLLPPPANSGSRENETEMQFARMSLEEEEAVPSSFQKTIVLPRAQSFDSVLEEVVTGETEAQNQRSLAEEMRSAEETRFMKGNGREVADEASEDQGVIVSTSEANFEEDDEDIDVVHIDSVSEGTFELVELEEKDSTMDKEENGSSSSSVYIV
ncbi:hypothetical protein D9757_010933 [Collybiopsis confluens]|uniref:Uncharacterized protein n=1 Tax=Collybiopsis confluens TaxID=2823264 RepID=A0A8H5GK04_9AGAR|nr:hypothetical protein D9757_010933 [Collybiopsis confluens]